MHTGLSSAYLDSSTVKANGERTDERSNVAWRKKPSDGYSAITVVACGRRSRV